MTRDDIIRMAREAGFESHDAIINYPKELQRFAALVAAAEREKVAQWMIQRSYATGHGDTTEDLLAELEWQIAENWNRAMINGVEAEREACAKVCDEHAEYAEKWGTWGQVMTFDRCATAIRARGQND